MGLKEKRRLCEALWDDFKHAPETDGAPMSAQYLAAGVEKSVEWVYTVKRGELVPSLWDLLRWEATTEGTRAVQWINGQLGLLAVPMPTCGNVCTAELNDLFAEAADYLNHLAAIYRDGVVDASEAAMNATMEQAKLKLFETIAAMDARYDRDCRRARTGRASTMAEAERFQARRRG